MIAEHRDVIAVNRRGCSCNEDIDYNKKLGAKGKVLGLGEYTRHFLDGPVEPLINVWETKRSI